jgi:hypothetical protein
MLESKQAARSRLFSFARIFSGSASSVCGAKELVGPSHPLSSFHNNHI